MKQANSGVAAAATLAFKTLEGNSLRHWMLTIFGIPETSRSRLIACFQLGKMWG
jgi:hypothetical protein